MMQAPLVSLLAVTGLLSLAARLTAGPLALPAFGLSVIAVQLGLLMFFGIALSLQLATDSIRLAPRFVRADDGHVDIRSLVRSLDKPCGKSILIVLIAGYGIAATANLAEVYRVSSSRWHDHLLWNLEEPIFTALLASSFNSPRFWDAVYQALWLVLFMGLGGLARTGRLRQMVEALCAVVIAFHLTRYIAIAFPTAGPVFHRPELFDLAGTGSAAFVELLRDYMAGRVSQNSLLPGTQALPSLHVGLAWCAVLVMAREWKWTLWLTLPWFVLNWLATMFLGWHYFVDGIGGIFVMSTALWTSRRLISYVCDRASRRQLERRSGAGPFE
ncbi:phosphatase PAP2 family protein [Zeimonas arvi]|uniref:Inositolphosphotransferase Aur1/Ipt1 domain-containing protein n=1 Tax=Zeimonas arvi TaxID=2498847 RepID=A0A5C8NYK2_9BURK|nr:phosphatase PAP2 family protein [Zeimonas arvi]TXL66074.1 hypothetical protein FHP08_08340 [Zeimonas arvi]